MQYNFNQNEIDDMKQRITRHCESEKVTDKHGNKSAWRLRLKLEARAYCGMGGDEKQASAGRWLALYESLTHDDMPNFNND